MATCKTCNSPVAELIDSCEECLKKHHELRGTLILSRLKGITESSKTIKAFIDGKLIGEILQGKTEIYFFNPGKYELVVEGGDYSKSEKIHLEKGKNLAFAVQLSALGSIGGGIDLKPLSDFSS